MKKRIKRSPVLILASLGILGTAYIPERTPKPLLSREFISKVYARPTGEQRWLASEKRKKQILAEIRRIRKRIRLQAEIYYPDKNTKMVAYTAREKTNIHSLKLMIRIADEHFDKYNVI
jgi:hypothetical protein